MENIATRLKCVISGKINERSRYVELTEATGISGDIWKNFWFGRKKADAEMIEKICRRWPQYAFWLVTGITDPERGHVAPENIESFYPVVKGLEQPYATLEFLHLLQLKEQEPQEHEKRLIRKRCIEDSVFDAREKDIVPALYVSYEKVMRELGEPGKAEYFLLETDKTLRDIRRQRDAQEETMRKFIKEWRFGIKFSKWVDSGLQAIWSFLRRANRDN